MSPIFESDSYKHWLNWTRDQPTTSRYKLATWLFMIGAALQRRVWIGSSIVPIYPNTFVFFVAEPGVGKAVMNQAKYFLGHHKIQKSKNSILGGDRDMFPITADSTSYESCVQWFAREALCTHQKTDGKIYTYNSGTFVLDELVSIFHRYADDMVTFLLTGWKCESVYKRQTIGRGVDLIDNLCINMIGGTQPDKFADAARRGIISNGFSRRVLLICENDRSNRRAFIPEPTEEQYASRQFIHDKVAGLHKLYGAVTLTDEAKEYVTLGWEKRQWLPNNPTKALENFFESYIEHIHKMAMAVHFSDSTTMELTREDYERAHKILQYYTSNMHLAFANAPATRNVMADEIIAHIKRVGASSGKALYVDFAERIAYKDFLEMLGDLQVAGRLKLENNKYIIVT